MIDTLDLVIYILIVASIGCLIYEINHPVTETYVIVFNENASFDSGWFGQVTILSENESTRVQRWQKEAQE